MERNHYFLLASLPPLCLEEPSSLSLSKFHQWVFPHLSERERGDLLSFQRIIDLHNLRALWAGNKPKRDSLLPIETLEERSDDLFLLSPPFSSFLRHYLAVEERLSHFPQLLLAQFRWEINRSKGFLHEALSLLQAVYLISFALQNWEERRDWVRCLQDIDAFDPLIDSLLKQREMAHYTPPVQFRQLEEIFATYPENTARLREMQLAFLFSLFEEKRLALPLFSFSHLLCYLIQLSLLTEKHRKRIQEGEEVLETIIQQSLREKSA